MLVYIIKRLLMTLLVLLLIVVFLSLLVHIVPGDPATMILGPRATPEPDRPDALSHGPG